tara:strand:+ start:918 stop:1187 length:270 start_codon:yes stop_codon:yes gene_type:complete
MATPKYSTITQSLATFERFNDEQQALRLKLTNEEITLKEYFILDDLITDKITSFAKQITDNDTVIPPCSSDVIDDVMHDAGYDNWLEQQ